MNRRAKPRRIPVVAMGRVKEGLLESQMRKSRAIAIGPYSTRSEPLRRQGQRAAETCGLGSGKRMSCDAEYRAASPEDPGQDPEESRDAVQGHLGRSEVRRDAHSDGGDNERGRIPPEHARLVAPWPRAVRHDD